MPKSKISQLPSATSTTGAETFLTIQGGVSKNITLQTLFTNMKSTNNFSFDVQGNNFLIKTGSDTILSGVGLNGSVGIGIDDPSNKLHVGGNFKIGEEGAVANTANDVDAVYNGVFLTGYDYIGTDTVKTAVGTGVDTTLFAANQAITFNLGVGISGQSKTFVYDFKDATGTVTIQPSAALGWIRLVLTKPGDTATVKFVNDYWVILSSYGASIVTS